MTHRGLYLVALWQVVANGFGFGGGLNNDKRRHTTYALSTGVDGSVIGWVAGHIDSIAAVEEALSAVG
ncbi:MAG: hypothetical protein AAFR18_21705 [Cyanobacteria bacterium J06627_32]